MAIYTKTGDRGTTSLYGGKRLKKSDKQIAAYGTVDELSSYIGLVVTKLKSKKDKVLLVAIQEDLYQLMSALSGAPVNLVLLFEKVSAIEEVIDNIDSKLPPLTQFIVPGGTEISAMLHVVRTICRRAEREVVALDQPEFAPVVLYLNRLSDLFFVMARSYNQQREIVLGKKREAR